MFPYPFLTTIEQALNYRENLDSEETKYLYMVDKFTAKHLKPGSTIDLLKYVKLENLERFYIALSYILIAAGIQLGYSEDYLTITRYE